MQESILVSLLIMGVIAITAVVFGGWLVVTFLRLIQAMVSPSGFPPTMSVNCDWPACRICEVFSPDLTWRRLDCGMIWACWDGCPIFLQYPLQVIETIKAKQIRQIIFI